MIIHTKNDFKSFEQESAVMDYSSIEWCKTCSDKNDFKSFEQESAVKFTVASSDVKRVRVQREVVVTKLHELDFEYNKKFL